MKKQLSFLLALLMVFSCLTVLPLTASAEGNVAEVIDSEGNSRGFYSDFGEALNGVNSILDNYTIRLVADVTISSGWVVDCRRVRNFTIDGNGHTITQTTDGDSAYALTITGKGKVNFTCTLKNLNIVSAGPCVRVAMGHVIFDGGHYVTNTTAYTSTIVVNYDAGTNYHTVETNPMPYAYAQFVGGVYEAMGTKTELVLNLHSSGIEGRTAADIYGGYYHGSATTQRIVNVADSLHGNIYGGTFIADNTASNASIIFSNGSKDGQTVATVYGGVYHMDASNQMLWCNKATARLFYEGGTYYGWTAGYRDPTGRYNFSGTRLANDAPDTLGASVRLVPDSNGLRFTSQISKGVIDRIAALKDAETELSFGTIICPTDYLTTSPAHMAGACMTIDAREAAGKTYLDIPAVNGIDTDDAGNVTVRAAVVNLLEDNIDRAFSAVAYVKAVIDGIEVYFYGYYNATTNSASIREIASMALADVKDAAEEGYDNLVSDGSAQNGKYSPYSAAQRAVLAGYLA